MFYLLFECVFGPLKGYEATAGGQTTEAVGISHEIFQKLQDTAAVLTQERKKKGKSVPQGLAPQEAIQNYRCVATHTVSGSAIDLFFPLRTLLKND